MLTRPRVRAHMNPYQLLRLSFIVHLNQNGIGGVLGEFQFVCQEGPYVRVGERCS